MTQQLIRNASQLMKMQRFAEALPLLLEAIESDPSNWNSWYMAGQCLRFTNCFDDAIKHLSHAASLKPDDAHVLLALGIVFQLTERWDESIRSLRQAIEIDNDFASAFNSLALTQKKKGELDKAAANYELGVKALIRKIVGQFENLRDNPILKHEDTRGDLWAEYALEGMVYLAFQVDGISSIATPQGREAMEEERTEKSGGLYWRDFPDEDGGMVRYFLPNYFNTVRERLKQDPAYANLIGNRGTVLELLGHPEDAGRHFDEANEFLPSSA